MEECSDYEHILRTSVPVFASTVFEGNWTCWKEDRGSSDNGLRSREQASGIRVMHLETLPRPWEIIGGTCTFQCTLTFEAPLLYTTPTIDTRITNTTAMSTKLKILVPVKRVIDYAVRLLPSFTHHHHQHLATPHEPS